MIIICKLKIKYFKIKNVVLIKWKEKLVLQVQNLTVQLQAQVII